MPALSVVEGLDGLKHIGLRRLCFDGVVALSFFAARAFRPSACIRFATRGRPTAHPRPSALQLTEVNHTVLDGLRTADGGFRPGAQLDRPDLPAFAASTRNIHYTTPSAPGTWP